MPECLYDKRYHKRWLVWDIIEQIGSSGLPLEECIEKFGEGLHPKTVKHYMDLWKRHGGDRMRFMAGGHNGSH
jgi:hypothetical protein